MSSHTRKRRWAGGAGMPVGAAFAAALIGLAPATRADTEPDPFEDLFGTAEDNSWTVSADNSLASSDPTLAANLDASVDNFEGLNYSSAGADAPFTGVTYAYDPSAFTGVPYPFDNCVVDCPTFPLNATGDFALGLDYTVFASGLAPTLDALISDLSPLLNIPEELLFAPLFLLLIPFLAAA
jgi:hypothetical protein